MDASGLLMMVPVGDALAVKEGLSLESAVSTLRKLDGRDKATKIMQYGARFLVWWFATTNPALSQRASKLYRTTQQSRKAFRMLKILDEVVKLRQILRAAATIKTGSEEVGSGSGNGGGDSGVVGCADALAAARCLAMGAFWTFDNLNYLTVTETVDFGVARATKGFARSWSVASALSILLGISALRKTEKKRRDVAAEYAAAVRRRTAATIGGRGNSNGCEVRQQRRQRKGEGGRGGHDQEEEAEEEEAGEEGRARRELRLREALTRANAEHFKAWLMVLKGALDLTCAVNITGVDLPKRLLGRKLNDGVIGAAGCASALCVLYNSWPGRQQQQQQKQQKQQQQQAVSSTVGRGSTAAAGSDTCSRQAASSSQAAATQTRSFTDA